MSWDLYFLSSVDRPINGVLMTLVARKPVSSALPSKPRSTMPNLSPGTSRLGTDATWMWIDAGRQKQPFGRVHGDGRVEYHRAG